MALTNFAGAVAVITGGASGIGLATARALRAKGAHVVLADTNSEGLRKAEQELRQHNPDIASMLQLMNEDQDKAERLAGEAFYHRTRQASEQQA